MRGKGSESELFGSLCSKKFRLRTLGMREDDSACQRRVWGRECGGREALDVTRVSYAAPPTCGRLSLMSSARDLYASG